MSSNHNSPLTRRSFLGNALASVALAWVVPKVWPSILSSTWAEPVSGTSEGLIERVNRPFDAETKASELMSWITPNDRFFVRSHFGPAAADRVDAKTWRLRVVGLVEHPLVLSLSDLAKFNEVTITAVVQCSGNGRAYHQPRAPGVQWERGAVGNAAWTGVRLKDVLERAGMKQCARHLQMQGADRPVVSATPLFVRSIPIEKALHTDTILAYQMNGRPLPLLHGAPLRLITPGWMANACVKWLTDLTLQEEETQGYYMQTAYRYPLRVVVPGESIAAADFKPVEAMVVKSVIAAPSDKSSVKAGDVMVQGVAWTGEGRIVKVEVSTDEGRTWEQARLVGEDQPYAWRQWQFVWRVQESGVRAILSRATDDRGQTQPMTSPWNPSGYLWNGWDRVTVTVAG